MIDSKIRNSIRFCIFPKAQTPKTLYSDMVQLEIVCDITMLTKTCNLKNKQKHTFVITNMRNVKKQSHLLCKKKQEKVLYTTSLTHSETVKMSLSQKLTRSIKI